MCCSLALIDAVQDLVAAERRAPRHISVSIHNPASSAFSRSGTGKRCRLRPTASWPARRVRQTRMMLPLAFFCSTEYPHYTLISPPMGGQGGFYRESRGGACKRPCSVCVGDGFNGFKTMQMQMQGFPPVCLDPWTASSSSTARPRLGICESEAAVAGSVVAAFPLGLGAESTLVADSPRRADGTADGTADGERGRAEALPLALARHQGECRVASGPVAREFDVCALQSSSSRHEDPAQWTASCVAAAASCSASGLAPLLLPSML